MTIIELIGYACGLIFTIACLDFVSNMQNKADDYLERKRKEISKD